MFWGLTPALNCFDEFENVPDELNVLLIGGADCRHVFKTLSKRYEHKNVKLNFYLMESCPETIAKQLLMYYVALQSHEELGLIQKTRIFMELYGNTLLRPSTGRYLTKISNELVKIITDVNYMNEIMPNVNLELKYKERDYLENLFKFWCGLEVFNISECWDKRVRKALGVRYDAKNGAFDWDLYMRLRPIGGGQVCSQEYQSFRTLGVSFTWIETEATKPNRSMVCGVIPNGERYAHYGYLGDIETGPFVAYGLSCEDEEFSKKTNNMNTYRSTDVTERNLKQIFYEMLNDVDYIHQSTSSFTLGHLPPTNDIKIIDVGPSSSSNYHDDGDDNNKTLLRNKNNTPCVHLDNVTINFMSLSNINTMKYKVLYHNLFHLIYFNSVYMKHFDVDIVEKISKSNCKLIIENRLFILSNRKKELDEYKKDVYHKMDTLKCKRALKFDVEKDYYIKYLLKEQNV